MLKGREHVLKGRPFASGSEYTISAGLLFGRWGLRVQKSPKAGLSLKTKKMQGLEMLDLRCRTRISS
jgi:hypothetical protein